MRAIAGVRLAILLAIGAWATAAVAGEAENEATAGRYYTEFNARNLAGFGQFMAADIIDHNPAPGQKPGLQGMIELNQGFIGTFDDIKFTPSIVIAKGDYVTVYSTVKGTQTGDFLGVPATKKPIDFTSIDIWLVKDGKLAELWHVEDVVAILAEIGAIK